MEKTKVNRAAVLIVYILIIISAGTIPFIFESPSLFYKTGLDKILLRTGKIVGIVAMLMMSVQVILTMRFKWLENIFGMRSLYRFHRHSGIMVLLLALLHPVLILGADDFVFFSFEKKYWPEFAGIGLLILLSIFVLFSVGYRQIGVPARFWKIIHRVFAPVLIGMAGVHVTRVSRSFESGVPFWAACSLIGVSFLLFAVKVFSKDARNKK